MSHKNRNKKSVYRYRDDWNKDILLKRTQEKENLRPSKGSAYKNSSYGCGLSSVSCGRAKESPLSALPRPLEYRTGPS